MNPTRLNKLGDMMDKMFKNREYLDDLLMVIKRLPEDQQQSFYKKKLDQWHKKHKHVPFDDCNSECQPTTIEDTEKILVEVLDNS